MQIPEFFRIVIASGIGTSIVAGLIWSFRAYLGNYLKEKAKNLATKQDIATITRLQEDTKSKFKQFFERQRIEADLRLAVVESRFKKHQEAHTLWIKLFQSTYSDKTSSAAVKECELWWEQNSLYLDPDPRFAFRRAYIAASWRPELVNAEGSARNDSLITENWERIVAAGAAIEDAVHLPVIDISEVREPEAPEPTALG